MLVVHPRPRGVSSSSSPVPSKFPHRIRIVRFPMITFDRRTGEGNPNDWLVRLSLACIRLQCIPVVYTEVNMLPVDIAGSWLVEVVKRGDKWKERELKEPPLTAPDLYAFRTNPLLQPSNQDIAHQEENKLREMRRRGDLVEVTNLTGINMSLTLYLILLLQHIPFTAQPFSSITQTEHPPDLVHAPVSTVPAPYTLSPDHFPREPFSLVGLTEFLALLKLDPQSPGFPLLDLFSSFGGAGEHPVPEGLHRLEDFELCEEDFKKHSAWLWKYHQSLNAKKA